MTVDTLTRAVDAYRRTAASRSAILLVVANLLPLIGVLFFGWSLWTILVLYWVENGIVGFWNIPRILLAQGANAANSTAVEADPGRGPLDVNPLLGRVRVFGQPIGGSAGRSALAFFFLMHYGIFWFVHGIFVFLLPTFFGGGLFQPTCDGLLPQFDPGAVGTADFTTVCGSPFGDIVWPNVVLGAVLLFVSHGASFLFNYIGRGEYLTTTAVRQMAAPYGRVIVLHVTIIFGAFAIVLLGAPIGALLILIGLKTALDLAIHLRERRGTAPVIGTSTV